MLRSIKFCQEAHLKEPATREVNSQQEIKLVQDTYKVQVCLCCSSKFFFKLRRVQVVELLALLTSDQEVLGLKPTGGRIQLMTLWCCTVSLSPAGLGGSVGCASNDDKDSLSWIPCQVQQHSLWRLIMKTFLWSFSPFC